MPSDEMRERAREHFEEWAESKKFSLKRPEGSDGYPSATAQAAWLGWLAGAREELRSAAREMREVLDAQEKLVEKRSYPLTEAEKYAAGVVRGWADWLERRA